MPEAKGLLGTMLSLVEFDFIVIKAPIGSGGTSMLNLNQPWKQMKINRTENQPIVVRHQLAVLGLASTSG